MNPFLLKSDPAIDLMRATSTEFEKILSKGAMGQPLTVGDYTIVPLLITSFGIGTGGGSLLGESLGGGGGGGVIPCAVLIIGPNGVEMKVLPQETTSPAHQSIAQMVSDATSAYKRGAPDASTSVAGNAGVSA
ncbi:spore germination protein GerW family protein [Azospirillum griseum]|uniref:Sporulation protein YtfJ n=1 Tax=Azospirillum griseum TaxID=2496639 RepID=A0A3S0K5W0_9PROT|nr:spore germination protein GerW family protein [Azospirillum griseum]RTR21478.1 hypothetical protein EJ903_08705 [Azospirillum griseum]